MLRNPRVVCDYVNYPLDQVRTRGDIRVGKDVANADPYSPPQACCSLRAPRRVFLAGLDTEGFVDTFYFVRFPMRGRREVLKVKAVASVLSMCEANLDITLQSDITFKINVMLNPAYCSPELLPRLFANIAELYSAGARRIDWHQMLRQLPNDPAPGSNWALVAQFVQGMGVGTDGQVLGPNPTAKKRASGDQKT